ncbi:MAG TPA: serine/threonine-protein kinase [Gemmatimonadales bacterium]|nr:serine/threonine-protein kinase [Gemmatimonadales bacterium]
MDIVELNRRLGGSYQVERELGRGGMGIVYLAREVGLDRLVALKVLPPHLATDPSLRARFLREARTAAQLSHPNIVPIYRAEEVEGLAYFAMGYVEGENLAERVRDRGPLPAALAVRVLREAAWALAYAHARGVIHRDVKAANIMVERGSDRTLVTDFGIARDVDAPSITGSGEVIGTLQYMSPEQANGQPVDGRSDLFSLGVVGYQVLSGRLPFEETGPAALLLSLTTRAAPSLGQVAPSVAAPLVDVIDRCLRPNPSDRYATGEALADALTAALEQAAREAAPSSPDELVPTERAQAIWLRAAQLQADAASRLERRSRDGDGLTGLTAVAPSGGYRLRDVEAAAREVGIAPEFVALARAELPAGNVAIAPALPGPGNDRATTLLLGTSERSLSVTRVIPAAPRAVLEMIGRVFPSRPWLMTFKDTVGGHPLDGGVMVFTVPNMTKAGIGGLSNYTSFTYRMHQLELFQLNVTLRRVQAGAGTATEVTVHGDLRPGLKKNLVADYILAGSLGGGGALAGSAVGLKLGAFAVAGAAGGLLLFGVGALAGYRLLYRHALRQSVAEVAALLEALEAHLRGQQVFGASVVPDPPVVTPGDGA